MQHYMCVRFVFRPSEKPGNHPGSILCYITVDKRRKKFTTPVSCLKSHWDATTQELKGKSKKTRLFNDTLTDIEADILRLYYDMERAKEVVTAERLLKLYLTKEKPRTTLLTAWEEWLKKRTPLVGVTISSASLQAGEIRLKRVAMFLQAVGQEDMLPDEFTAKWCDQFMEWMRVFRQASQNYTNKVVQTIKQVLRWCVRHEYAKRYSLDGYGLKFAAPKVPVFLSWHELERLRTYPYANQSIRQIAHLFLFQSYTGLAYADLQRFRPAEHITIGMKGRPIIIMQRQKTQDSTGQEMTIPLRDEALALRDQYPNGFPVPTNQVYNRMLKELASVVGLPQHLTTHIGRKTAGRLFLDEGLSMAAVSKILGHRTVAMTEKVYVRVGQELVEREFERVFGKPAFDPPRDADGFFVVKAG